MARFLELDDVEQAARHHQETFFIPRDAERKGQKIGDSVQLHFLLDNPGNDEPRAERMWVTITQAHSPSTPYKGVLENNPVYIDNLAWGDEVTFSPCHIARIMVKEGSPDWIDSYEHKAIVSKMCLEKGGVVRFLYREQADREEDSGWRMLAGMEDDAYSADAANVRVVDVGYMLDRDPSLLGPLRESTGAAFEREDKGRPWRRLTDWTPT